jgi:hypothetical protein
MQTCHPVSICPSGEKYGISSEDLPLEAGAIRQENHMEGLLSRMGVVVPSWECT